MTDKQWSFLDITMKIAWFCYKWLQNDDALNFVHFSGPLCTCNSTPSVARFLSKCWTLCVVWDKTPHEVTGRTCFQIKRDTGLWYSVEYSSFSVGPESDFYRLSVSGYSGDAGDALAATVKNARRVNGRRFSTPDDDNDSNIGQCWGGITGWWFKNCARSTINLTSTATGMQPPMPWSRVSRTPAWWSNSTNS